MKIVIFGGGSGLSQILKGLKLFPVDITAVVTVADNGQSTGKLREEMQIPAVGDISKVLMSMSNSNEDIHKLMHYRFLKSKTLGLHSVKNLILTALLDVKGSLDKAIPIFSKLLDIEGTVLPLTEDSVNLIGITKEGKKIIGEEEITNCNHTIVDIKYDKKITINPKISKALQEADLIILGPGSLYTSIMPHLIDSKLNKEINSARAEVLYICNLFTQPGETDELKVSDHIKIIEKKLGKNSVDIVVANTKIIEDNLYKKYVDEEQKEFVIVDKEELKKMKTKLLLDNLLTIEENYYRHDSLKTAYLIFDYLMRKK